MPHDTPRFETVGWCLNLLRQVVTSEIILSVGYDAVSRTLEVQFRNGWIYRYDSVPEAVYRAFMSAPSHGKYLKRNIVDKFSTTRVR